MRIFVALLLLAVLMTSDDLTIQAQNRRKELHVARTVERFYSHFSRREYDKMWDMLSDAVKEGNDNNKASYIGEVSRFHLLRLKIEIKNVKISESRAIVTLTKRFWMNGRAESFLERHEEVWIKQKGQWLFDGSRILSDPRSSLFTIPPQRIHCKSNRRLRRVGISSSLGNYSSTQGRLTSPDEFTSGPEELYVLSTQPQRTNLSCRTGSSTVTK